MYPYKGYVPYEDCIPPEIIETKRDIDSNYNAIYLFGDDIIMVSKSIWKLLNSENERIRNKILENLKLDYQYGGEQIQRYVRVEIKIP